MNPIGDEKNNFDWQRFIYQDPNEHVIHHRLQPTKAFELNPSEKAKKDLKKNKDKKEKDKEKQ